MSRRRSLEAFKFAIYLLFPPTLVAAVVYSEDNLMRLIKSKNYIVYPPEGPRPPSLEELQEIIRKQKEEEKQ